MSDTQIQQKNKKPFNLPTNGTPKMTGGLPQAKDKAPFDLGQDKNKAPFSFGKPNAKLAGDSTLFFTK